MLRTELETAQRCLLETFELAANYGGDEFKDTSTYLMLMEKLCSIQNDAARSENALAIAEKKNTLSEFEATYDKESKRSSKKFNAQKTADYKAFSDRLQQIRNDLCEDAQQASTSASRKDGDLLVMASQVNRYDPLTKQLMTQPMRNKICNHTYEKSSILEAIKNNRKLRCPVAGCGNNQFIKESNLFEDNALKMHLTKLADQQNNLDD